jgi:hypothetical protein
MIEDIGMCMPSISADDDAEDVDETVECDGLFALFSWLFLFIGASSMSSFVVVSSEDDADEDDEDEDDEEEAAPDDMFEYLDSELFSLFVFVFKLFDDDDG